MKTWPSFFLLLCLPFCVLAQQAAPPASPPAVGQVVWWGKDDFLRNNTYSNHTNGLIEKNGEFLTNVIAVAGQQWQGLALKSDGTVSAFGLYFSGGNNVPAGLGNVISISVQGNGSCWAVKHDGTVVNWGNGEQGTSDIVAGLTNSTAIAWAGEHRYLALQSDGTVLGFNDSPNRESSFDNRIDPATGLPAISTGDSRPVRPLKVHGQVLSNVVALASMGDSPLILKNDGRLVSLNSQGSERFEDSSPPFRYAAADPVIVDGKALTNVVAVATAAWHALVLKSDGMVVVWGKDDFSKQPLPAGLSNVTAIATSEFQGLALKRDGTVVAWSQDKRFGQTSVPAGLSNVVAIATTLDFSLAVTTGNVPSSVFVQPHGRLETMAAAADLVFKGRVISTVAETNTAFPSWGKPHATKFEVISVIKGDVRTNIVVFHHNTGGPNGWGGGSPPWNYAFETGRSFIVFAVKADKPDYLYSPPTNIVAPSDQFRQVMQGEFAIRTLDSRPVNSSSIKEASWIELNLLLNDTSPTNQLYAIEKLDTLSLTGRGNDWMRSDDFKRKIVLSALQPLITNHDDRIACRAMNCFAVGTNAVTLEPFAETLIGVATAGPSSNCRLSAIDALSGFYGEAISHSLTELLKDPDEDIRVGAVRLLPRFPDAFAEHALRERAEDKSANVRSVVADVIGDEKFTNCLPTLEKLFADPVGKDPLIKPMTMEYLKAGQRWSNIGDVHTSAGLALVKFAPDQVSDILKSNLDDPGFHINFVAKLAQGDPEPWLKELVGILKARRAYVDDVIKSPWDDPRRFADPKADTILIGTYTKCWEDIRQYLLLQPPEKLAGREYNLYLDTLEKSVRPVSGCSACGVQEARWLYQLYWDKHLEKRADRLRQQYDKVDGWWFDDYNKRGEAAEVGPITF